MFDTRAFLRRRSKLVKVSFRIHRNLGFCDNFLGVQGPSEKQRISLIVKRTWRNSFLVFFLSEGLEERKVTNVSTF